MKNRRKFLHLSALGFLSPMMLPLIKPYIIPEESKKGIVKQPEDGETFFVRENTPITIQISKKWIQLIQYQFVLKKYNPELK